MDKQKLRMWQERLDRNESQYDGELSRMDARERQYAGGKDIRPMVKLERMHKTPHVRNISAELVEAQVNSSIPQPKVTARREKDQRLANIIEDMLRNELDRMPFEQINDMMERTVPIQGGGIYLLEWDNTMRTHTTIGELTISAMHPKQVIPQDGVYTGIEDMDYIFLKVPQTKEYIFRRYGVDVSGESESDPDVKSADGETAADDMVTQIMAFYRNESGGIGLYSWVNNTELEDLEDYQARRLRRCKVCGAVEPMEDLEPAETDVLPNGILPGMPDMPDMAGMEDATEDDEEDDLDEAGMEEPRKEMPGGGDRKICPYCGSDEWEAAEEEFQEVWLDIQRSDGTVIPGAQVETYVEEDEDGVPHMAAIQVPTKVPFYKPNIYPVILQKNVSVYGKFLGDSDLDKIESQQNTTNRIEAKIIEKLVKSGSYITLPDDASIRVDSEDMKIIRPGNAANKAMIGVYDMQANVEYDLAYLAQVYEEARQEIGITDSFQGRQDSTATSGKAKEFAAAQSAGRLESKRIMKDAAYAALFEAMFKFKLAYADEPRPVVSRDENGNPLYETFNKYDFLEQDDAGNWYWNDNFIFSCDTSAPLANNREAMWQETRMNLQTGAFGDPASLDTLILFWTKMDMLHYPGAGETKRYLEEKLRAQQEQQRAMMAMAAGQQQAQQAQQDAQTIGAVLQKAKQDAQAAAQQQGQAL